MDEESDFIITYDYKFVLKYFTIEIQGEKIISPM